MSLRLRLAILTSAALITGGYATSLAIEPLCSVFRSTRHHPSRRAALQTSAERTARTLAEHH
jgi:hypothetical protein